MKLPMDGDADGVWLASEAVREHLAGMRELFEDDWRAVSASLCASLEAAQSELDALRAAHQDGA